MVNEAKFSDIKPTKQIDRLIFCSNCGEKQLKLGQLHCSNCGEPFYSNKQQPLSNKTYENKSGRNLNTIGGWLTLPYIGFYIWGLVAIYGIIFVPFYGNVSIGKKFFLEILAICIAFTAIASIIQIHKHSKQLIGTVTILYVLGFILSINSGLTAHSLITPITYAVTASLWILYFHKSKRVAALLNNKTTKGTSSNHSSNRLLAITLPIVAIVVLVIIVSIVVYSNHQNKVDQNKLLSLNSQLQSQYNQLASLPSSTTYTKSEWDSYYQNIIKKLKNINNQADASYSNPAMNSFDSAIETTSSDFINSVSLAQSASDMSFQIQSDQNTINSDKSLIIEDSQLGSSYVQAEEIQLTQDEKQLSSDQQTYTSQESQLKNLDKTLLSELYKLDSETSSI